MGVRWGPDPNTPPPLEIFFLKKLQNDEYTIKKIGNPLKKAEWMILWGFLRKIL